MPIKVKHFYINKLPYTRLEKKTEKQSPAKAEKNRIAMQMAIDLFYFSLPVLQQPLITEAVSKLKITKRKMPQQRLVTDIPIPHIYIYIYCILNGSMRRHLI